MNTNFIINTLATKNNGAFFRISYCTDLPLTASAKRTGITAIKLTVSTVRKGIAYDNMKSVQAKVEQGKELTHILPWGSWKSGYKGLIIEHKEKTYLRLYSSPNKSKSKYFLNGVEVTKEQMKNANVVQNSYWNKPDTIPDCITVNTANVQEIG